MFVFVHSKFHCKDCCEPDKLLLTPLDTDLETLIKSTAHYDHDGHGSTRHTPARCRTAGSAHPHGSATAELQVAVVSVGDLDIGATGSYYSFSFMIFSWATWTGMNTDTGEGRRHQRDEESPQKHDPDHVRQFETSCGHLC